MNKTALRSFSGFSLVAVLMLSGCAQPYQRPASYRNVSAPLMPAPTPVQVFFYATKGQTPEQVDRDRFECHEWAVSQSGYDPSQPHATYAYPARQYRDPAPGANTAAGLVTGAAVGAIAGGPRNGGEGAVIGAVAGAIIGSTADAQREAAVQRANENEAAKAGQIRANQDARADGYRRALSACGAARGYEVR